MTEYVIRVAKAKVEVFGGYEVLADGQRIARYLWNQLWWEQVGWYRKYMMRPRGDLQRMSDYAGKDASKKRDRKWYGRHMAERRDAGDTTGSLKGKLPKRPGKYTIETEMRDFWAYRDLADRCASYTVAEFDANMRSWFSNLKRNPDARPPRPMRRGTVRPLRFEPGRNAKHLDNWTFRLTVKGGHFSQEERWAFVKLHMPPGVKLTQVRLIQVQPDCEQAIVMYRIKLPELVQDGLYAAIDLGIINLGCVFVETGESILYSGKALLDSNRYHAKRAAKCKPSGYPKPRGQYPKPSPRQRAYIDKGYNRQRLAIHNFTTSVIRECQERGVGTLFVGNLTGIRKGADYGKRTNQKLHGWPFAQIVEQLRYKGEEVGIEVVSVSERGTSSMCPACGAKTTRPRRGLLVCSKCGLVVNSDLAGAINILTKYRPDESHGVEGTFPALPSPALLDRGGEPANCNGSRIHPAFVARFDPRSLAVSVRRCGASLKLNVFGFKDEYSSEDTERNGNAIVAPSDLQPLEVEETPAADGDSLADEFPEPAPPTQPPAQRLQAMRDRLGADPFAVAAKCEQARAQVEHPDFADPTHDGDSWSVAIDAFADMTGKAFSPATRIKLAGIFRDVGAATNTTAPEVAAAVGAFKERYPWWDDDWPSEGFCQRLGMLLTPDAEPAPLEVGW